MSYEPRPDTLVFRALAHMELLHKGSEISNPLLANKLGVNPSNLIRQLEPAVAARAIFCRQKGGHARSPLFWSLVDHSNTKAAPAGPARNGSQTPDDAAAIPGARPGSETPQKGANRDVSAEQSHACSTSDSGAAQGNGLAAVGAAPAFLPPPDTPGRDSLSQVLKAEGESPDATGEHPATASPSVGSMGAGQPADAGLTGGDRVQVPARMLRARAAPRCDHGAPLDGECTACSAAIAADAVDHFYRTTIDEAPVLSTAKAAPKPDDVQVDLLQRELAKPIALVTLSIQCTPHQAERIAAFVALMREVA